MKSYTNMTIPQFKEQLGVKGINLAVAKDASGKETDILRSWDNTNRIGIALPKSLLPKLQNNPELVCTIMYEERLSPKSKQPYKSYFIFMGTSIVASI